MMKILSKSVFLIATFLIASPSLSQEPTTWKPVKRSLTSFLDDGWRIVNTNDMQWGEGMGSQLIVFFVLEKGGKYVRCEVVDPNINKAISTCLALN
jgi:hypothetical protein